MANSGWVRHTLESAAWGLLTTDSFEAAVVQVVNLGNDADTAGAVVGALAGAAYGLAGIPARWRDALRGEWPLRSGHVWRVGVGRCLWSRASGRKALGPTAAVLFVAALPASAELVFFLGRDGAIVALLGQESEA
ncbi:MAG: ADP-ribosylglycohydrolase family protein [Chloroflexi bacterium]|nr:ADP-ribosylglycohydrolase family protein [Chloroflexota bacterium]MBU1751259.1 ADP-ribosylglycohydrolase family protein [Chloroflexota bacterium]